jgi:hypothetical protein
MNGSIDGTGILIVVCFFIGILCLLFEIALIIRSYRFGTYFLPDLYFDEIGTFNKVPLIIFGIGTGVFGFLFIYYGLAVLGINPYIPNTSKVETELIFATLGLLFSNGLFPFLFGIIYRKDGMMKKLI